MVVYLAAESPASVRKAVTRLSAASRLQGAEFRDSAITDRPIQRRGRHRTRHQAGSTLEGRSRAKCRARHRRYLVAAMGRRERKQPGEDMSHRRAPRRRIRHEARSTSCLIHHSGKDAARGMRGWSGMRAATDTEIEITADEDTGRHVTEVAKQRDIPGKGERIGFRLQVVEMGVGKWGKPITSCVVVSAEAPAKRHGQATVRDCRRDRRVPDRPRRRHQKGRTGRPFRRALPRARSIGKSRNGRSRHGPRSRRDYWVRAAINTAALDPNWCTLKGCCTSWHLPIGAGVVLGTSWHQLAPMPPRRPGRGSKRGQDGERHEQDRHGVYS